MTALRRPRPFSDPPDVRLLGIDEAGRGCVLGSLVVGAYLTEHPEETLRAAGAGDSKRMSMTRREQARSRLESLGEMHVREITAAQIDAGNLNTLEEEAIVSILQQTRPDEVRIDALGPPSGIPRVIERLQAALDFQPTWVMQPKADHTFAVVGAASIVAKTTRDRALAALDAEHGPLGSGYPSDPVTRAWLLELARARQPWPHFVRTRWGTVQTLSQQAMFEESGSAG